MFIWHSDKAYIGFSIPNFIETNRYDDNEVAIFKEKISYYLIAGYVFDLNDSVKFKPALLTKMVEGAPLQVDVSGNFMFYDKFMVGACLQMECFFECYGRFSSYLMVYTLDMDTTRKQPI